MGERQQKQDKPDEPETRAEAETEVARREMVYLLRAILEEVHNQRQAQSRPADDDDDGPRHHRLHGEALEALHLFHRMEAQIDIARSDDLTGTDQGRRRY